MKKLIIPISALLVTGLAKAQLSTTENYIYTKTYLNHPDPSDPTQLLKASETVQYFDGLGRPKQIINIKASPSNKDLVTTIPYDGFGRQVDSWLPAPMPSLNGGIQSGVDGAAQSYYSDSTPFTHQNFEASPLDRVLSQVQPGLDWQGHAVQFGYDANVDGEVIKYTTTTTWENGATKSTIEYGGTYIVGQLYKNTVTDEDGNKTIEFKNGKGQVVLVRKVLNATDSADTYYVYNEYDQLAWVIPPLLSKKQTWGWDDQQALSYEYRYDGRNRLVEKRLPGKDWEYMVYDKADRLVLTQDGNQRPDHKWSFNKYDKFGRIIYTGIAIDNGDRNAVQGWILFTYGINTEVSGSYTQSGMQIPYGNTAYPQNIESILTVNFYDTYPTGTSAFTPTIPNQSAVLTDNMSSEVNTKSLPLASYVKNIEDDNWTKNYSYYDTRGRVIATHSINHLGGYTKTESKLEFSGLAQQTITRHKRLSSDTEKLITETFTYDLQNRLKVHKHKVDSNPEEILAQNEYNELSQLTTKKVGGSALGTGLQEVNYAYNIRGWMTQINDPANLGTTDLFGYKINYNLVEGMENPHSDYMDLKVKPKFNGNIAETSWRTATTPNDNLRRYGYVYDGLNRLKAGFYQKDNNPSAREYFEKMDYDLNGNITHLQRSGALLQNYSITETFDDLTYHYENNNSSNRLSTVTDASVNYGGYPETGGNTIPYDLNGNMTSHEDKGILGITYNFLNLPSYLLFNAGLPRRNGILRNNTSYLYRADGVKLRKIYKFAPYDPFGTATELSTETTEYLDGFQYLGSSQNAPKGGTTFKTNLLFYPTSEGYYDFLENRYIYNYTDHLGNVRLSYFKSGSEIKVLEENNYYPFGLKHNGYNPTIGNLAYQYKYNGKELQTDSGMYDYGARFYMPDLGRWGVIDPLAEAYTKLSPYNYTLNNPILFIDPDGTYVDTSLIYEKNKDGSYKNPNLVKAWNIFATSKAGINYLKDFVSAGQKIAGVEYKEGGKFDKAGIDITFDNGKSVAKYNSEHLQDANGITTPRLMNNGRLNFEVSVSNLPYTDQAIENIAHEFAQHLMPKALDFFDNKKFDFSNGYESLMDYKKGYTPQYYSKYYGDRNDQASPTGLEHQMNEKTQAAEKLGVPIIKVLYQKNNIKRTDEQIKKILFSK
ncbi:MAG: DUF6443 domain-containing protein [Candidatus Chryseobacterium colombiense]|nr:DUF6443 domain-containing protein [Chryseobacterium sp.]WEK69559.1 MAG: DUF6443 domain-containing protein [Chryseobacterium sp.]